MKSFARCLHRVLALVVLPSWLCHCQGYPPPTQSQTMPPIFGPAGSAAAPAASKKTATSAPSKPTDSAQAYPSYPAHPQPAPPTVPLSWRVDQSSSPQRLAGGAGYHEVRLAAAPDRLRLNVVVFDSRRCRLRVIDQPDARAGGGAITHLLRAQSAVAGINGGFFTADFRPLGLVVSAGRAQGSFERTSLITGMALQLGDQPYLIWNNEYQGLSGVSELLQSGPRLLDSGRPVAGLEATKKRARSFIATDGGFLWAIGTTEPCSLAVLADALAAPGALPGLAPLRALNLDGGNSSALWMRTAEGREISRPGWSTVRNYLAIVPK